ncbi:hypothetical protein [Streptomyces sp. MMG1121]|uniref:hypothetical protein n=1 Tax=Streptomyces sp. MMG1121 TaxID=1415544 RepID=UPI0006AF9E01
MSAVTSRASTAAPEPAAMTTVKPVSEGSGVVPKVVVIWARTTPATGPAPALDVPVDRMRVLMVVRLSAAAVSAGSRAPMISAGTAP